MDSSIHGFGHVHCLKSACQSKFKNRMANSVDLDETAHNEPSHLDLQCLQKCVFWFTRLKGLKQVTKV